MRRPHLQTGRLILRPLQASDEAAVVAGLNDWDVARWLALVPYPYGPADFRAFLPVAQPGATWVIDDGHGLAGVIGNDSHFGYWLVRRAWGRGYATEAGRAVLATHFADPGAATVVSSFHQGNVRSAGVLRKLGFRCVGHEVRRTLARPDDDVLSCQKRLSRADWRTVGHLSD